jgi:hypothetical protein
MFEYEAGTGRSRVEQHQIGLAMLSIKPLAGVGPGLWRREAPRFAHAVKNRHTRFVLLQWVPASDLLRHAVETGLLGIVAAAAMALSLLVGACHRVTKAQDVLTLALMGSLVVAIVISGFDALLARPASVALVAAVAGMLRNECERRRPLGLFWSSGAAAVLAAIISLCIFAPRYLALKALADDFSAATVLRLGRARLLPFEALSAVLVSENKTGCSTLVPAATLVDAYLPNEPENLLLLARCAERQGRLRDAEDYLRRALVIEPHDASAERRFKEVSELLHQCGMAFPPDGETLTSWAWPTPSASGACGASGVRR